MPDIPHCWCGNRSLVAFSQDYWRCPDCETLVARQFPDSDPSIIRDDATDLYGASYFERHLAEDYGLPGFAERVRSDLPERCLFWLQALLRFKTPPATLLELGCFHGGFVALARLAGYSATGLDLSPRTCAKARELFGIEVMEGPIENQSISPQSLDIIALFDVLEHLADPLRTLAKCKQCLSPDGLILVQTPQHQEGTCFDSYRRREDPFLVHLKPKEHLYIFSKTSVTRLFSKAGLPHLRFEPAIFSHYDMFFGAAVSPITPIPVEEQITKLSSSKTGRIALALIELKERSEQVPRLVNERNLRQAQLANLQQNFAAAEADRIARGQVIEKQGRDQALLHQEVDLRLKELHALQTTAEALRNERNLLQAQLADLQHNFAAAEADRLARGVVIEQQGHEQARLHQEVDRRLKELHQLQSSAEALRNERNLLQAQLADLQHNFAAAEADRLARGEVIEQQGRESVELNRLVWLTEQNRDCWKAEAERKSQEVADMRHSLQMQIDTLKQALTGQEIELAASQHDLQAQLQTLEALRSRWWFRLAHHLGLR